ncbi:MAG: FkbM family methyltransferase [Kiritimatiellia bacterium]|jgi:FkbM family methyltransferase
MFKKLRESGLGVRVFDFLAKARLDGLALRLIHGGDMRRSRVFFRKHAQRVDHVCEALADAESREVFRAAIAFRQSYARKNAPAHEPEQYFPRDVVRLSDHEVFVDCGAFTGDTVERFVAAAGGCHAGIVCFEPDPENFNRLSRNPAAADAVLVKAGVWSEAATLRFSSGKGAGSKVSDGVGHASLEVKAIDEVPECEGATFIKMDVEGAELHALRGAARTIAKNRPVLAVSIYHSDEDMLAIPEYLMGTLERYVFHVRHHSLNWQDTVMYAVPIGWRCAEME